MNVEVITRIKNYGGREGLFACASLNGRKLHASLNGNCVLLLTRFAQRKLCASLGAIAKATESTKV